MLPRLEVDEPVAVDQWVGVALSDCAHVGAPLDLEVASVAPSSSPRVLDVPEAHSVLRSVSGGQHSVVDVVGGSAAVFNCVDSACVGLEASNDLEGDGHWSCVVESLGQFHLVSLSDVEGSMADVAHCDLSPEDALSVLGSVGVGHIGLDAASVPDVLEGVGGKTALTAVVVKVSSAVHQLLLGEGHVLALAEQVPVGLEGADGGEGPAGAAGALVLDGGDHSEVVPLIGIGDGLQLLLLRHLVPVGGRALLGLHESLLLKLLPGHIREVVDALAPAVPAHVVVADLNQILAEDLEPEIGLGGVGGVEFVVDFAGSGLGEEALAVDEGAVLDVEVQVAEGGCKQARDKQDF